MSAVVLVRDSRSGEHFVLQPVEENGYVTKSPDNKKPAVMMARLQLHPDPNTNAANNQLAKFEPESPQSPGAESQMSFNVYEARFSGSDDTCLGALPNSASTIGFLPDHHTKGSRMVPGYSRKIQRLSVCLVLFIAVSLVMTGLFVWRTFYYDSEDNAVETKVLIKEGPVVAPPKNDCPVRAKAVPLTTLPKSIQDTLSQIEEHLMKANAKDKTVSIMANVVYMDQVIWERSFGKMNQSNPTSPKPSSKTVFPVASVTKVLTALMLYKLYHEKKVKSLDDPFKKYMPRFSIQDPFNSHETVLREMVSHMSGFPREAPCLSKKEGNLCPHNNTVMLERIKNLTLIAQPGNKVSYSNLGFGLLGQGLALSQNTSYEDWMQKNIFDPLEMNDSGFKLTPEIPLGYLGNNSLDPIEWGWANPAGGMFTSLADIAKLEIKLFNSTEEDDFLTPVMTEEFFSPAFILDGKQFMGSPWEMYLMNGYLARMKNGFVYGYSSNLYLFPDLKLAFNIFNTGSLKGCCMQIASKLLTAFHEELTALDKQQQPSISEQMAAPYLGEFLTDDVPTIRRVIIKYQDGKMYFFVDKAGGFLLNHLSGTTFELIDRRKVKCLVIVVMGINHEKVHFDAPSSATNWISPGFTVFGFHLRGKAHFYRKQL
ncbi:hypothetical protein ACROYT_G024171 [Oculina patagonica]